MGERENGGMGETGNRGKKALCFLLRFSRSPFLSFVLNASGSPVHFLEFPDSEPTPNP